MNPSPPGASGSRRRSLATAMALCVAVPFARTQPGAKLPKIGFLASGTTTASSRATTTFRDAMKGLGWVDGRNVAIEFRFAEGDYDRLPALAAELAGASVDVIVALPTAATVAASRATTTIPIVAVSVADPVGLGLARSLARPGGNVTGLAFSFSLDIWAKWLQLLTEALPHARTVAVLINPASPGHVHGVPNLKAAAQALNLSIEFLEARTPEGIDAAFARIARRRVDALVVLGDPMLSAHADRVGSHARQQRLPTMHGTRQSLEAFGLILYAPDLVDQVAQAAGYVDRILKGARPGDLPFEQPKRFELVINLRTAKALGLTLPQSLLLRADQLIE